MDDRIPDLHNYLTLNDNWQSLTNYKIQLVN